jgi:NADH-quinone oxidoreductase subunit M
MVNHGLYTAALFILIAVLYKRLGTFSVSDMRGLQRRVPVLAGVFTVVMLASIGVPGLNGFVGEFLILAGTFLTHRWWAVVATAGVVLAAVYLLWAYQQAFQGKPTIEPGAIRDLSWREGLTLAPLVILIVLLGIFPGPLLNRIGPSVTQVVTHVEVVAHQRPPQVGAPGVAVRSSGAEQ